MTQFRDFSERCKMRHDFGDQIQVRLHHPNEEQYDAWVSGSEALQRLDSREAEEQLQGLSNLSTEDLKIIYESLPRAARNAARDSLRDELSERLGRSIGGNIIGDALAQVIGGASKDSDSTISEKERWTALIQYEPFRQIVLQLAWIQLEGSFPDIDTGSDPDDWH